MVSSIVFVSVLYIGGSVTVVAFVELLERTLRPRIERRRIRKRDAQAALWNLAYNNIRAPHTWARLESDARLLIPWWKR